jgi:hypothetical protein
LSVKSRAFQPKSQMLFLVSTITNPPRLTFRAASESNPVASPVYRGFSRLSRFCVVASLMRCNSILDRASGRRL